MTSTCRSRALRRRRILPGAAALIVSASVACSSSSVDGYDYYAERARVMCRQRANCCSPADLGTFDFDACVRSSLLAGSSDLSAAHEAGQVTLDENAAGTCLKEVSELDCLGWSGALTGKPPAVCEKVFIGHIGLGGACRNDFYCASTFCFRKPTPDGSFESVGVCAERAALGELCNPRGCARGLACTGSSSAGDVCRDPNAGQTICWAGTGSSPFELF